MTSKPSIISISNLPILITRPTYPDVLKSFGYNESILKDYEVLTDTVIHSPCLKIEYIDLSDSRIQDCVSGNLNRLIITSLHAIPALKRLTDSPEELAFDPTACTVFCVGDQLKTILSKLGFQTIHRFPKASDLLNELDVEKGYLYLRGQDISLNFKDHIASLKEFVVYRACPETTLSDDALDLLKKNDRVICPVYSKNSFLNLNKLLTDHRVNLNEIILILISNHMLSDENMRDVTAKYQSIHIAKTPSHAGVLECVKQLIRAHK